VWIDFFNLLKLHCRVSQAAGTIPKRERNLIGTFNAEAPVSDATAAVPAIAA
jgi:hypothetical protein